MQRIASTLGAISTAGILLLAIPGTAQAAYGNLTVDSTTIKNPHGCFNSHRYPMFVANETDAVAEIYTGPNCSGDLVYAVDPDTGVVADWGRSVYIP